VVVRNRKGRGSVPEKKNDILHLGEEEALVVPKNEAQRAKNLDFVKGS